MQLPIPPAEHPRLGLRAKDIPELKQKAAGRHSSRPLFKECWEKIVAAAALKGARWCRESLDYGVQPGDWQIRPHSTNKRVKNDAQVLYFIVGAGDYTISNQ